MISFFSLHSSDIPLFIAFTGWLAAKPNKNSRCNMSDTKSNNVVQCRIRQMSKNELILFDLISSVFMSECRVFISNVNKKFGHSSLKQEITKGEYLNYTNFLFFIG